jgi:hypothetical protein
MEAVIWYYAFGKPVEKVEIEEKRSVQIIHEYIRAEDILPEQPGTIRAFLRAAADGDAGPAEVGAGDGADPLESEAG